MLEHSTTTQTPRARLTSSIDRGIAMKNERNPTLEYTPGAVLFTLYTVYGDGHNVERVGRYFDGATLYRVAGFWKGVSEDSEVIEVVGTLDDMQRVTDLAGDIRHAQNETAVLVTYARIGSLMVTA